MLGIQAHAMLTTFTRVLIIQNQVTRLLQEVFLSAQTFLQSEYHTFSMLCYSVIYFEVY